MSSSPTVIVKKGGVLTALVSGVFGLLMVCTVCVAGIGWYAMNVVDRKTSELMGAGRSLAAVLPEWRKALPVIADALDDRRAPEYRDQLDVTVRLAPGRPHDYGRQVVVEVTNRGSETVSFLTARVVLTDRAGVPRREYRTFIATPVSLDEGDWRGPLLPRSSRRFGLGVWGVEEELDASIEITDVRVWNPGGKGPTSAPTKD
jgi:hypothetical protein